MGRVLAARGGHSWTPAVTKGAPCSLLLCCQQWVWGPFSWTSSLFWAPASLDRLHREGKVSNGCCGAQPAQNCPGLHVTAHALPGEGALWWTAFEIETQDAFLSWRQFFVKGGEADFSCLHEWKHCMQHKHAVYCLTYPLKGFLLLASRLMW